MNKHSPAPFSASATMSSDLYNIRYITDAEGNDIAVVRYPKGMSQEEALANAALFKAAPALLAVLEAISAARASQDKEFDVDAWYLQARAAIAGAKGEK